MNSKDEKQRAALEQAAPQIDKKWVIDTDNKHVRADARDRITLYIDLFEYLKHVDDADKYTVFTGLYDGCPVIMNNGQDLDEAFLWGYIHNLNHVMDWLFYIIIHGFINDKPDIKQIIKPVLNDFNVVTGYVTIKGGKTNG